VTSDDRIDHRFQDLVDDTLDRDMAQLIGSLDRLYGTPTIDVARRNAIRQSLSAHHRLPGKLDRASARSRYLQWPMSAAALMVAVLVLVGGTAIALSPRLRNVIRMDPGAEHAFQTDSGLLINESKEIGPYVITIQNVYADGNRVMIGYRVDGPTEPTFHQLLNATLTDDTGRLLPQRGTLGSGDGEFLEWFDTAALPDLHGELNLRFNIGAIQLHEWLGPTPEPVEAATVSSDTPASDSMVVDQMPIDGTSGSHRYSTIQGPWTFAFSVPLHGARVATPHLRASDGPQDLLLEQVRVSPSEVRLYFNGDNVSEATIQVLVGDWDSLDDPSIIGTSWTTEDGLTAISLTAARFNERGTWRVIVTPRRSPNAPYVFEFQLPGASGQ